MTQRQAVTLAASYRHDDPDAVYELPFAPGARFGVTQGFNSTYTHKKMESHAVDWGLPVGTPVHAARRGVVVGADGSSNSRKRGRGNFIWIRHADGTHGWYLHLRQGGVLVNYGDEVETGQLIGYSGNTGKSSGPHLHFQVSVATSGRYAFRTIPFRLRTAAGIVTEIKTGDRHRRPR
ncbi:MAG: M23 family metallopeptidase [Magnetovibrio sp.]|nr:M23 family metallopeptidase [Magnetovibrio sp.]